MLNRLKSIKLNPFIIPSIIGFSILYLIPFLWGIKYSMSRSGFDSTFVGFHNYAEVFASGAFRLALKNTGIFMGVAIPLIMLLSFLLSLALYELKPPKLVYIFIMLPIAIPSAAAAGFFRKLIGTGAFSLMNSDYAMVGVILIFIWKNTGYNLIINMAGLLQLDTSVLEASKIDGATYFQRLRKVIIPLCTPTTVFAGIVTIINSFKVFKDVYVLQGSYPNPSIYMLQHYMNNKFADLQYEKLTSAAYIFAMAIFAFAFLLFYLDKRYARRVGES